MRTGWTGTAGLAHPGGPTSVLIVNLNDHRATGLYYTEAPYDELARAIGATRPRDHPANPRVSTSTANQGSG